MGAADFGEFRCVMCRAEAHELYSRKPIFDALGVQLVAVLNEFIDPEVCSIHVPLANRVPCRALALE